MLQNAKVGDTVRTRNGRLGTICTISPDNIYPIEVYFASVDKFATFSYKGIYNTNETPSQYDIKELLSQKQETESSVEYLSDLNVHIYHSPNGQSFQIYPQLKDKHVI